MQEEGAEGCRGCGRVRQGAEGAAGCGRVRQGAEGCARMRKGGGAKECRGCRSATWRAACSSESMAGVRKAESLIAWQLCMELEDLVFAITATGGVSRNFDFCDQIRRSSGAPAPHIAEGFGRFTPREFARYLRMALSSLGETQTHLERGRRRNYFTPEDHGKATTLCARAHYMTTRLLQSKLRQIAAEKNERDRAKRQRRKHP
jgi:four helix bundle protein